MKTVRLATCLLALSLAADVHGDTITHFTATLSEDYVILGGVQGTGSAATGTAQFTLTQPDGNPGATTLTYSIQFQNVDLDGAQTPSILDDITALHLHDTTACSVMFPQCIPGVDTAGTVHLLNIYGAPRNDDADVVVDPVAGTVTGIWDDSDASPPGTMFPTLPISDPAVLDLLLTGKVAVFVHTNEVPAAASGGPLVIVPEPASALLGLMLLPLLGLWRRRRAA